MNLKKRLSELEEKQQPTEKINISISEWTERDRTELEALTGIKFEWTDEINK